MEWECVHFYFVAQLLQTARYVANYARQIDADAEWDDDSANTGWERLGFHNDEMVRTQSGLF